MKSAEEILSRNIDIDLRTVDYYYGVVATPNQMLKAMSEYASQGREWIEIKSGEDQPKEEGKYLCCNFFKLVTEKEYCYQPFVSNFEFSIMRSTGERVIDEDGFTGVFQDNAGYGKIVTHWMPLPPPPKNS